MGRLGMIASDEFSQYYAELLQGTYDCVDRIVLNAFYPLGQTGGGVRSELSRNLGDENRLKAAYRGGCRALPEPPERSNTPCREIPRSFLSVSLMLSKIP